MYRELNVSDELNDVTQKEMERLLGDTVVSTLKAKTRKEIYLSEDTLDNNDIVTCINYPEAGCVKTMSSEDGYDTDEYAMRCDIVEYYKANRNKTLYTYDIKKLVVHSNFPEFLKEVRRAYYKKLLVERYNYAVSSIKKMPRVVSSKILTQYYE